MEEVNEEMINFWEYITGPELWATIATGLIRVLIIVLLAYIVVRVTRKLIYRVFQNRQKGPIRISERREKTLKKLASNVVAYVVYFIAIIMILDNVLGFQVGALLAGAGVAGLAIGFGAQNLVRDIITGFFIIFEDQFSVGDYIYVAGVEGFVEEIGLRTTKVLSWTGEMNVIPNGDITQVTNYSVNNGLALVDINIPYESSVDEAEKIINKVAATLPEKYDFILSIPEVIGVQDLEVSHYTIRVIADTEPGYQWAGGRNIRKEMQDELYKSGIELPAPRVVMYSKEEENKIREQNREREQ
jgi:small conductance mechanosensitive channel